MFRPIILSLILCAAVNGFAEEHKKASCPEAKSIAADQVPAAAVAGLTKLFGGTAPGEYILCQIDGKDVYCAKIKGADGAVIKFAVGADGTEVKNCGDGCATEKKAKAKCCPADDAPEVK